jgi:hypothetical protein
MDGVYVLMSVATVKALDSDHAGNLYTLPYNNGSFQKWNVIQPGRGWVNVRNVATGRDIGSNHQGNVYTLRINFGPFQKWVFFIP